jgi:hypothetical protein
METTSTQFHQLLDEHWGLWLKHDPLFATYAGVHLYDHLLPAEMKIAPGLAGYPAV